MPVLDPNLLRSVQPLPGGAGDYPATLEAHGLFQTLQFVLRLSPEVHRRLSSTPDGITNSGNISFEQAQAFSTYLHETVHWWQHIGSTYGLMLSLSYPTQAHANFNRLRNLVDLVGFKKSILQLAERTPGRGDPGTAQGDTNIILNNHFDFAAFRNLTFSQHTQRATVEHQLFESTGHAFEMALGSNIAVLASTVDPGFQTLPHPKEWDASFRQLREKRERGFFYGSPVEIWPVSGRDVLEGQACFCQLQYLAFASGGRLGWEDFRALGMLHGVYLRAFEQFLNFSGLDWPPQVDHPTVGLFMLICDMAINSGSGFPHRLVYFPSFIADTDPGMRFTTLSTLVRLKCPEVAGAIQEYTRAEYEEVCTSLARAMIVDTPLEVAATCAQWAARDGPFADLMEEIRYVPLPAW